jgi:hypothetical protein
VAGAGRLPVANEASSGFAARGRFRFCVIRNCALAQVDADGVDDRLVFSGCFSAVSARLTGAPRPPFSL